MLDVNPGAGLLSTKLHSLLKPRRHILLEPDMKKYQKFLNPLLEEAESTYHHVPLSPFEMQTYDKLFDEGYLPEQSSKSEVDGLNNSLFVLANFTQGPPEGFSRGFLFMRFLESYLDKTLFNRYGLVRVLGLVPTIEGDIILPKHVRGRRRTGLLTECVSKEVAEVAATQDHYDNAFTRGYDLIVKSNKEALARQAKAKIYSPEDRALPPFPLAPKIHNHGEFFPLRGRREWHDAFEDLHNRVKKGKIARKPNDKGPTNDSEKTDFDEYTKLKSRFRMETRSEIYALERVKAEEEIEAIENSVVEMLQDPTKSLKQVHAALDTLEKKRTETTLSSGRLKAATLRYEVLSDEVAAYRNVKSPSGEPLLLWDRRPYEPMMMSPEEVYPEDSHVTFIDLQPNPNSAPLTTRREQEKTGDLTQFNALVRTYSQLLGIFSLKGLTPLGELTAKLFPGRSVTSLMEAIPDLKPYALRKVFEPVSARDRARSLLRRHRAQTEKEAKNELLSYSENCLNYTPIRHLPAELVWHLTVEWFFWPGKKPGTDISKIVGGGLYGLVPENIE